MFSCKYISGVCKQKLTICASVMGTEREDVVQSNKRTTTQQHPAQTVWIWNKKLKELAEEIAINLPLDKRP